MGWMDAAGITGPAAATPAPPDVDLGPPARRARAGRPAEPAAKSDAELGIDEGVKFANPGNSPGRRQGEVVPPGTPVVGGVPLQPGVTDNPMTNDPIAQAVVAAPLAAGAAELAGAGALASGAAPVIARVLGSAAGGAVGSGVTGQDPAAGAAIGAAGPLVSAGASAVGKLLAPASEAAGERLLNREATALFRQVGRASDAATQQELEKLGPAEFRAVAEKNAILGAEDPRAAAQEALAKSEAELRAAHAAQETAQWNALPPEERLYRQVGQLGGPNAKAKIASLGQDKVVSALQRAGVSSLPDAATAAPTIKAAQANVGQRIGTAYTTLDSSGARWSTVRDVMDAVEKLKAEKLGAVATKPEADAIDRWMKDFYRANKGSESTPVSASSLNREIGALQSKGFAASGVELPQGTAAKLGRDLSGVLDGALEKHLARAARFSPTAGATATELRQLNQDYRVLATLKPLVVNRAAAERFAAPAEQAAAAPIGRLISKLGPQAQPQVSEYRALRAISDAFGKQDASAMFGPTRAERFGEAIAHPVATAGKLAGGATQLPGKAITGSANAADLAIARLFTARAAGGVTPDLLRAAEQAGVAAPALQYFRAPRGAAAVRSLRQFGHRLAVQVFSAIHGLEQIARLAPAGGGGRLEGPHREDPAILQHAPLRAAAVIGGRLELGGDRLEVPRCEIPAVVHHPALRAADHRANHEERDQGDDDHLDEHPLIFAAFGCALQPGRAFR
jgi:hypothetical protein